MRGQALALAGAAMAWTFAAQPVPALAQPPAHYDGYRDGYPDTPSACERERTDHMVAGGLIGAVTGAIFGSNVAGRGARAEGGALGAVAGAIAGGAIGRSTTDCSGANRAVYRGPAAAPYADHGDDGYDLDGGPSAPIGSGYGRYAPQDRYARADEPVCQYGQETARDGYGRAYRQSVYMCRGADGVWRPRE